MPVTEQPNIRYPIGLLEVGDSFFLPCISDQPQWRRIQKMAEARGIKVSHRMGIDRATGLYGMRVVRIL
jgi:hypothetical protein